MSIVIPDFKATKIVLVGDVMLDRYWHGDASRISPEAPVPVVKVNQLIESPGGAGNVALNLRELGAHVRLFGMIGEDDVGVTLTQQLQQAGVETHLQRFPNLPTVNKLRVIGRNQQLIRLDFEQGYHEVDASQLLAGYEASLADADVVIISDYAKGISSFIPQLIQLARQKNIPVLVDPKSRDFSLYRGASLLTPNLKELEHAVGACPNEAQIVMKGERLLSEVGIDALLVTRGEHGMSLLQAHCPAMHVPTIARQVYDVTGAGDTVIAVLGAAWAAGAILPDAVTLANTAAGIAVRKLGAATVSVPEIRRALQRSMNADKGLLSEDELVLAVSDAKAHNETVVMTNGCFDILHAGHVHYLEQAKALGKRLIVAVNDDASVARLKGHQRPIVPLAERMALLAALSAVDWVVAFSEETPQRLIAKVLPDILVKGGDYQVNQIAGAAEVIAAGGVVEILDFVPGMSTTTIVNRIKELEEVACI